MMRLTSCAWLVYVAFVLETVGVEADPRGIEPRWLLLAAAHLVWTQRLAPAVLWGGVCGLLSDALASGPLGGDVAIVSATAWIVGWLRHDRRWTSGVACLVSTFLLTSACVLGHAALETLLAGSPWSGFKTAGLLAFGQGAMTALWGGGLWLTSRILTTIIHRIVPPLDWRPVR